MKLYLIVAYNYEYHYEEIVHISFNRETAIAYYKAQGYDEDKDVFSLYEFEASNEDVITLDDDGNFIIKQADGNIYRRDLIEVKED